MPRIVGKWFAKNTRYINSSPKYRFVEITERIGKEYVDEYGYICQKVYVNAYGYKLVGIETKPYVSDTRLYMPDGKPTRTTAVYRYSPNNSKWCGVWLGSFDDYKPWDKKKPIEVVERYGHD